MNGFQGFNMGTPFLQKIDTVTLEVTFISIN